MDNGFVISAAAATHRGKVRKSNEDNLYFNGKILPEEKAEDFLSFRLESMNTPCVFAVCDGMGGLSEGAKASHICASSFEKSEAELSTDCAPTSEQLLNIITNANEELCKYMQKNSLAMGSTAAALAATSAGIAIVNIGDTRIYRVGENLEQLSVDHNEAQSLVKNGLLSARQARKHPSRNRLTQHIGIFPGDLVIYPSSTCFCSHALNETYLICTDGLYSMLDDATIKNTIANAENLSLGVKSLCEKAVEAGGSDNITVILINIKNDNYTECIGETEAEAQSKNTSPFTMRTFIECVRRLFDIRKKGQPAYGITPRLVMGRFAFAVVFFTVLLCVMSVIAKNFIGL